jgi:cell wall-associated NlpC family hydrolase
MMTALDDRPGAFPPPSFVDPVEAARSLLGAPYEWGGLSAGGIDCSGLVHLAFRATGRLVPRDSWQQEAAGRQVLAGEERSGDLVAYGSAERADHVAFLLDGGTILHATAKESKGVVEEPESVELVERRRAIVRL